MHVRISDRIAEQVQGFEALGNPLFAPMVAELREWHRVVERLESLSNQILCGIAVVPASRPQDKQIDIASQYLRYVASELARLRGWSHNAENAKAFQVLEQDLGVEP